MYRPTVDLLLLCLCISSSARATSPAAMLLPNVHIGHIKTHCQMTNGEGGACATITEVGPHAWWHGSTEEVGFLFYIFKISSSYTLLQCDYLNYGANGMLVFVTKTLEHGFDCSSTMVGWAVGRGVKSEKERRLFSSDGWVGRKTSSLK